MTQFYGSPISLNKAAKKYSIPVMTLSDWAAAGKISILKRPEKRGQSMLVDEGSVVLAMQAYTPHRPRDNGSGAGQPQPPPHPTSTPTIPLTSALTAVAALEGKSTAELVAAFLVHCSNRGLKQSTQSDLKRVLGQFVKQYPQLPLTPGPISEFIGSFKVAQTSKQIYYAYLQMFYRWLESWYDITPPFRKGMRPHADKTIPRVYEQDEKDRLFAVIEDKQDQIMIKTFLAAGIRVGELVSLDDTDVYPGYIRVRGKTGERTVSIPPWLYNQLRLLGPGPLFKDRHGDRMSVNIAKYRVRKYCKAGGLTGRKLGPHTLRHTSATEHLEETGDMDFVRDFLGHTDIGMTQRYTHVRPAKMQEKYQKLSPYREEPWREPGAGQLGFNIGEEAKAIAEKGTRKKK